MGIKERFKRTTETARETSKKISDGLTPNIHIGKHTYETLSQELIALCQTKPMFRDSKWRKRSNNIRANLLNKVSNGHKNFQPLILELNKIQEMR